MLFMSSVAELQELASWSVAVTWHSASLQSSSTRTPFSLQQVYTSTCVYAFTWFCCSVLCKPAQTTGPAVSRGYWLRTEGPWQRRICIRMPPPTRTRPFSARDCAHSIELDFLKKGLERISWNVDSSPMCCLKNMLGVLVSTGGESNFYTEIKRLR